MNRKFKEASTKLKERLASKGLEKNIKYSTVGTINRYTGAPPLHGGDNISLSFYCLGLTISDFYPLQAN
ncbi:hypothetical protein CCACVL1_30996 [Corchorus capsularis]|uniref:Uncharacterized protein n=1 Tax=Corchorus capsularis TaxID=210143 RepID=A0A1R3FUB9_COCAP|nr:hypothetical protein CCACVL1_30996 [Corchorus capsularis]